jgi:uncharacterized Tic20 family protein
MPEVSETIQIETPLEPTSDSKNAAIIFNLLSIFFGVLAAVVGYFISSDKPWLKKQMTELLNFQITVMIVIIAACILDVTVILSIVGIPLMIIAGIGNLIILIIAAMRASKGQFYCYPWTVRLLS